MFEEQQLQNEKHVFKLPLPLHQPPDSLVHCFAKLKKKLSGRQIRDLVWNEDFRFQSILLEVDATTPPPPGKIFLSFFLENKTSAPDVFSSCTFLHRADFKTSLVTVSCYGYEI